MKTMLIVVAAAGIAAGILVPHFKPSSTLVLSILLPAVVIAFVLSAIHQRNKDKTIRQEIANRFKDRKSLSPTEFANIYFEPKDGDIAIQVRDSLQKLLPYDLSCLSPDDRFVDDLHMEQFDDLSPVALVEDMERSFVIVFADKEAERILTIRDLVTSISSKRLPNQAL